MNNGVLVDSCVLLDIFTNDPVWGDWSAEQLAKSMDSERLLINPIIYGEVSVSFQKIEELESNLSSLSMLCKPLNKEMAFLAGKAFLQYKKRGGHKSSLLPDFYIGAHACIEKLTLLTRDKIYPKYFQSLEIISPFN